MRRLKGLFAIAVLALAVASGTSARAASTDTADTLFAQAKSLAQQQHKHVLLVFSASWCGPCKLYEKFLEDPAMKPLTDKAFVIVRIDVGERPGDSKHADTPGGVALRSALGAQPEPGYPFIIMTDEAGKPIVNSNRNGDIKGNTGYPQSPEEIDWYIEMLRRAAPGLSAEELAATRTWLKKHA